MSDWRWWLIFITVKETAEKWGISERRIRVLCSEGKIPGVYQYKAGCFFENIEGLRCGKSWLHEKFMNRLSTFQKETQPGKAIHMTLVLCKWILKREICLCVSEWNNWWTVVLKGWDELLANRNSFFGCIKLECNRSTTVDDLVVHPWKRSVRQEFLHFLIGGVIFIPSKLKKIHSMEEEWRWKKVVS